MAKDAKERAIKLQVKQDFGVRYEISETDKDVLASEFSKLFHSSTQMMTWFDNAQIHEDEKLKYFMNMYNILESLHELLVLMLKAGVPEKLIMEHLNIPF